MSTRALYVWRRNFEVYLTRWWVKVIPPILEPVLYVLAFGFGLGALVGKVSYQGNTLDYLIFMCPGILAVTIMFWAFFETTYSSYIRMEFQKTFDGVLATPLLAGDVIAGEWLWGATKSFLACSIMLLMLGAMNVVTWPTSLWVLPLSFLGGLLFSSMGLITTALSPDIESFNLPIFLGVMPMFMFSGTFFPIDVLPAWALPIAKALPLTQVSYLVRGACLGQMPESWELYLFALVGWNAVGAYFAFRLMKRRMVK
jgi:lipooligosaccharide transport system permease protein